MDLTAINTGIGIIAGLVTILVGIYTIRKIIDGGNGSGPKVVDPTEHGDPVVEPVIAPPPPIKTISLPPLVAGVQEFVGDDKAYQQWLTAHPNGYVVNTNKGVNQNYMVLHKATCSHVSNFDSRKDGAFTQRDFMKACASDIEHLRNWAKAHGRADGSFSGTCGVCRPS